MLQSTSSNFMYVECDVPDGLTLSEWRRTRTPRSPRRFPRLPRIGIRVLLRPRYVG